MLGKSSTFSSSSTTPPSVRTPPPVKVPVSKVVAKPPTPVFKCKKCQENFKTNAQLGGHKCWAECEKCSKTFTTKFKSEKHRLDEHTFKCNKCRHMTDSKENLGAHMDAEHSHFCDKCGSVFDSKPLLANHVVKEHSFKCGYCTKLLDSEEAVQVPPSISNLVKLRTYCITKYRDIYDLCSFISRFTKRQTTPPATCVKTNSHGWKTHTLVTSQRTGTWYILISWTLIEIT